MWASCRSMNQTNLLRGCWSSIRRQINSNRSQSGIAYYSKSKLMLDEWEGVRTLARDTVIPSRNAAVCKQRTVNPNSSAAQNVSVGVKGGGDLLPRMHGEILFIFFNCVLWMRDRMQQSHRILETSAQHATLLIAFASRPISTLITDGAACWVLDS